MKYHEAIGNAIQKIQENVIKPVKLECDVRNKSVKVYVMISGVWVLTETILDFDDVSHLDVEDFILGAVETTNEE